MAARVSQIIPVVHSSSIIVAQKNPPFIMIINHQQIGKQPSTIIYAIGLTIKYGYCNYFNLNR